jgi:signal transduction histidine kinase
MDDVLLLVSRLALLVAGVGGSLAVLATTAVRRAGRGWIPALASALILLTFAMSGIVPGADSLAVQSLSLVAWFVGFPVLAATFPDGRFVPRWSAWVVAASFAVLIVNALLGDAPRQSELWWVFACVQALFAAGIITYRYRRSATTIERESVRWVLLGLIVTVAAFMLILVIDGTIGEAGGLSEATANRAGVPLVAGLVVGTAWPKLRNVDAAFRAALIVLGGGWTLGGVYAATEWLARSVGVDRAAAGGWGTVVVAIACYPAVRLAVRVASWLVYRDRLGAGAAVARLSAALDADDARGIAQRVADVAAEATGSPDVWLVAASPADDDVMAANAGRVAEQEVDAAAFPIVFHGEVLATLHALPRRGESDLSSHDCTTLTAITLHAAPALHGARALIEATMAQAQLVTAREEERRQLRRELHDDLGPALAGLALSAAAIAKRADSLDARLAGNARELQSDIADAVESARDISHGLRPAILDDRGLEAALRDRIDAEVELRIGVLGTLPAAVDLATLRIVQEAVTNVRRHAAASVCQVSVDREGSGLRVEVADDGIGIPRVVAPGLGLRSIRERAAELGGRASVLRRPSGGTVVSVWLPVEAAR